MIPDYQIATFLGIPKSDLQILNRRMDFPRPVLTLPRYTYWEREEIIKWVSDLKLKPGDVPALIRQQQMILDEDELGPGELDPEWFTREEVNLEDENELAIEWLNEHKEHAA